MFLNGPKFHCDDWNMKHKTVWEVFSKQLIWFNSHQGILLSRAKYINNFYLDQCGFIFGLGMCANFRILYWRCIIRAMIISIGRERRDSTAPADQKNKVPAIAFLKNKIILCYGTLQFIHIICLKANRWSLLKCPGQSGYGVMASKAMYTHETWLQWYF